MLDQCFADGVLVAMNEGEDAFGKAAGGYGALHGSPDELRGARVCGMGFDDDRAAGGEGRCGVSSSYGKGEREVAGAEDGYWAEGDFAQTQVGAGKRLAVGLGGIEGQRKESALADDCSEEAELADCAGALAFETRTGKAGFGHGAFDEEIAESEDFFSNGFEEGGAGFERSCAIGVEGCFS
jgi:hypothetical protein